MSHLNTLISRLVVLEVVINDEEKVAMLPSLMPNLWDDLIMKSYGATTFNKDLVASMLLTEKAR